MPALGNVKPSDPKVAPVSVSLVDGVLLPSPFGGFDGNTWTVPTPSIDISSAPKLHLPEDAPTVPANVVKVPGEGLPATSIPAALVQIPPGTPWRQTEPLAAVRLNGVDSVTVPGTT
jgi:hypothetical protein